MPDQLRVVAIIIRRLPQGSSCRNRGLLRRCHTDRWDCQNIYNRSSVGIGTMTAMGTTSLDSEILKLDEVSPFLRRPEETVRSVPSATLLRGSLIPTPVRDYKLDWAIIIKEGTVKHIYIVAKTKCSMDLSPIGKKKIECARNYFAELNKRHAAENVRYDMVNNFGKLMEVVK
ncbi:hypothetical protein [Thermomonas sp.]|uniref:restriction endonuclease n=1 Tax=Thermomonas sp. TaxID=1971895 RepID=UPI001ECFBFCE|nr:hypothetical protein [Thermomonas sp.]MBK6416065.1 hypothetical protein [Thermomonas sp.]